jgi:hypothetical protein
MSNSRFTLRHWAYALSLFIIILGGLVLGIHLAEAKLSIPGLVITALGIISFVISAIFIR